MTFLGLFTNSSNIVVTAYKIMLSKNLKKIEKMKEGRKVGRLDYIKQVYST
ncbi:MAG: hypothetical protein SRB1_00645 [Desulfobacteraceae bacterium Eth-SRB1]|nr:MAG: hypothetical protein SRB1_00645 [Desulfobacteraceae bacterium Eth-SRB1]